MTTLSKNRIYCERKKVHVRIELGGKCYFLLFVFWLYVFTNVKGEVGGGGGFSPSAMLKNTFMVTVGERFHQHVFMESYV